MSPGGLNSVACAAGVLADVAVPVGVPNFEVAELGALLVEDVELQPAARRAAVASAAALIAVMGRMTPT
jgi:hypothetical protein